jgi:hypothetical protein
MTVEDVGGMPSARINRIVGADFLNQSCAPDARLESRLPRRLPSNRFFKSIGQNKAQSEQMFPLHFQRKAPRKRGKF